MGQLFGGDDIDFSRDTKEVVRQVRRSMDSKLQFYTTEASLDDFIKSFHGWVTGGCEPVRILIEKAVEAELVITAISSDQPMDTGGHNHVDFSAWVYFRTGSGPHVRGRFVHAWRHEDASQGSIYAAGLDDADYGPPREQ